MTTIDAYVTAPLEVRPALQVGQLLSIVGASDGSAPVVDTDGPVTTILSFVTGNLDVARLVVQTNDRVVSSMMPKRRRRIAEMSGRRAASIGLDGIPIGRR